MRRDGSLQAWFLVASGTRTIGFAVGSKGLFGAHGPVVHGGSLAMWPASMANPAW
jgi:hypothetical protein